ncbi:Nucleoside diphosphate kinase [Diplonema papillatum]|nr:Nucleoside diphosphate kinase [Diplonema papillatum]
MTDVRLAFIVDYEDPQAGLTRKYQLCYYTSDESIEMHDIKNRRPFLKRCHYPQLKPSDLYLDATIAVYARKLRVAAYGDAATQQVYAARGQPAFVVVPPDAVEYLGVILQQATSAGLRVNNANMLTLNKLEAEEFQPGQSDAWANRRIVALEFHGENAAEKWSGLEAAGLKGMAYSNTGDGAQKDIDWFFGRGSARAGRSSATMKNCTLAIVKPHAVAKCGGAIVDAINTEGFEISAFRCLTMDKADAADFMEVYKGVVAEYTKLVEQLSSGPCWVMEVQAEDPVRSFRELCGPRDPDVAKTLRPHTLRAKYGVNRVENAIHCTDLPEDGVLEADFFFDLLRPSSA